MTNIPYKLSLWKDISVNLLVSAMEIDMKNATENATIIRIKGDDEDKIFVSYDEETKKVTWRRNEESATNESPLEDIQIKKEFFDEVEVAELSSNTSNYPGKAININFNRNINGMNTLTFSLPKYFYVGKEKEKNELLDMMFPHSRVKLKYKDKWYSFIITNREERRDGKIIYFDYTCTDMLIYELSKTGYELSFDEEHDGQGTIDELAKKILYKNGAPVIEKDSEGNIVNVDWSECDPRTEWAYLDHESGEFIEKQEIYQKDESGNYVFDDITGKIEISEEPIAVSQSKIDENLDKIVYRYQYAFPEKISDLTKLKTDYHYYIKENESVSSYYKRVTYIGKTLSDNGEYEYKFSIDGDITEYSSSEVTEKIYCISLITDSDTKEEKENWTTQKNGRDIWGYSDILTYTPQAAKNMLSNGENFTDTSNWESTSDYLTGVSSRTDRASITTLVEGVWADAETPLTYNLVITPTATENDPWVYNTSLKNSKTVLEADTVYAIMVKFAPAAESLASSVDILIQTNTYNIGATNAKVIEQTGLGTEKYFIFTLKDKVNTPYFMIKPSIPTSASVSDKTKYGIKIEKVQFYKVIPKDLKAISPNQIASDLGLSESQYSKIFSKTDFGDKYILPDDDEDVITNAPVEEKINLYYYESDTSTNPIYFDAGKNAVIEQYTETGSQKVRTLVEEKSNYYNLLQTLAELFEGWIRFDIEYHDNGKIKRDIYGNQKKYIQFREVVGKNQWAGFHYGVNISSISRTINSDEIATKVWVENSESKRSSTGLVSIADSDLNEIGESFVYNFDYYMDIGSLDSHTFINDMFGTSSMDMAFSRKMGKKKEEYNTEYKSYTALSNTVRSLKDSRISTILQIQSNIENAKINAEFIPTTWSYSGSSSDSKVSVSDGLIYSGDKYTLKTSGTTYKSLKDETTKVGLGVPSDDQLYNYYKSARTFAGATNELYRSLEKINQQLGYFDEEKEKEKAGTGWLCDIDFDTANVDEEDYIKKNQSPEPYLVQQEKSQSELDRITAKRAELVKSFENKYRRFISEGTWSDNSYTDNNKYYLDAKRVAATSARPQISYSIDVLNLSSQEGYELFDIDVGDKTFICDAEFFGYDIIDNERTLHKESFVISEINDVLDNPSESTITVQNFRTQFEDLFSRISATIQTVQTKDLIYSRGENFTANGEILVSVLQQTLLNNTLTLAQSTNNNVIINNRGIEVIAINNTAKRLRIVADGIYVTTDGGLNWTSGFQADGMNAAFITTGQLNTGKVTITNDGIPSYSWDRLGITAYQTMSDDGKVLPLSKSGFVRFDQHGLYLLSTPTPQGASSSPISIKALTNGAAYYLGNDENKKAVVFDGTIQGTDINNNPIVKYVFIGDNNERHEFTEAEVTTSIYDVVVQGASAADFGYDSDGNPWFMSGSMMTSVLEEPIVTPTWGNRLDYIKKKALVSLTWRGLAINSKTGSVEIGTNLPVIRVYDNSDGKGGTAQFDKNNIARVDLGFTETPIGVPTRGDYEANPPTRSERIYGLTLRNKDGQTVLQTTEAGSLWLAENLFVGDTNPSPEDPNYGTAASSLIGIQGGANQSQGSEEYSNYIFWSKGSQSEQGGATSYNFTIDNTGHLTANSITISGDSSFDGTLTARNGNILGALGIGQISTGSNDNTIYNSGFASEKITYSLTGAGNLKKDNLYYLQTDQGVVTVKYIGTDDTIYTFESDQAETQNTYTLTSEEVNTKVFNIPNGPLGDDKYAIWVNRLTPKGDGYEDRQDGPIFSVTHDGKLTSQNATIRGDITAVSGTITGLLQVGSTNRIKIDGSLDNPSISNTERTFEILGTGTINAGDLNLTDKAKIQGYLLVGDSFAIVNPPEEKENGDAYDNGAVILSGEYQTYFNSNPAAGDVNDGKNYLQKYLDSLNPDGTRKDRTGEEDTEIKNMSNFVVTNKGEVIASNLNITGNNSRITGSLTIGEVPNRITISESQGIYQESNLGYNIWHIDKNGKATFNDITARGTIQSSVLKYNEIQCSSGSILVRPASKIHKIEIIDGIVWIWLEDRDIFSYNASISPIKITVKDFLEVDNSCVIQRGSTLDDVKILGYDAGVETVNGEEVIYLKIKTDLSPANVEESIERNYFGDFTFISLGREGEGGLFLNSSSTETKFGSPLALTIFENIKETADSEETETQEEKEARLTQNKKVILGNLSDIPGESFKDILSSSDIANLEGYGLYSDNAYLKGTITTGQSGITTLLKDKNGIVIWGQSNGNLNEISFKQEGMTDKADIIDYWRENDAEKYGILPNFFVSDDGFLFAKQGYFAGTINSDDAIISGSIGIGGLKISDETGQLYISYDDPETGEEMIAASFNRNGLHLFSSGDLEIYKTKVPMEDFPPEGETPYIFSDDKMEGLVSQKILVSELPDSQNTDYGVLIKEQQINFVKRVLGNSNDETRQYRAAALGGERLSDGLRDSFLGTNLATFNMNDSDIADEINLSISVDSSESSSLKIYKNYLASQEARIQKLVKTQEVNFDYNNVDAPISSVSMKAVDGGIDIFVLK